MTRRTRRQIMEDSMQATAMAAEATTPMVHAEETKQSDSPNEKLGVAVVGVRGRGGSHIGAFAGRKDTEILYIVDADSDVGQRRACEVGKRQGGRTPQFVEDMRRAFEDDRVDTLFFSCGCDRLTHLVRGCCLIVRSRDLLRGGFTERNT